MRIYIMRHGEAESLNQSNGFKDNARSLTYFGHEQAKKAAKYMANQFEKNIDLALVSPYVRAQQTHADLTQNLSFSHLETSDMITPNSSAQEMHDYLDGLSEYADGSIMLVSHMPFVSYLLSSLCRLDDIPLFATAAVAVVDYDCSTCRGEIHSFYGND